VRSFLEKAKLSRHTEPLVCGSEAQRGGMRTKPVTKLLSIIQEMFTFHRIKIVKMEK
jgi:hypothetical protein